MIILAFTMAAWALLNWVTECYKIIDSVNLYGIFNLITIKSLFILIGDVLLTGLIVATFPLAGILGATIGLFMSNGISVALRYKLR